MTKKQREMNVGLAVEFMKEIKMLASSVTEDISDAEMISPLSSSCRYVPV